MIENMFDNCSDKFYRHTLYIIEKFSNGFYYHISAEKLPAHMTF